MLKALNLSKIVEFESDRDPDKGTENATKFKIGAIPSRVYAQLKDKASSFTPDGEGGDGLKAEFKPNMIAFETVKYGLKGIENFDGVEFKTQEVRIANTVIHAVHDDVMAALDIEIIRELSLAIRKICEFEDEEIKN